MEMSKKSYSTLKRKRKKDYKYTFFIFIVPVLYIFSPNYHICNEKKLWTKLFYIVFIAEFIFILFLLYYTNKTDCFSITVMRIWGNMLNCLNKCHNAVSLIGPEIRLISLNNYWGETLYQHFSVRFTHLLDEQDMLFISS